MELFDIENDGSGLFLDLTINHLLESGIESELVEWNKYFYPADEHGDGAPTGLFSHIKVCNNDKTGFYGITFSPGASEMYKLTEYEYLVSPEQVSEAECISVDEYDSMIGGYAGITKIMKFDSLVEFLTTGDCVEFAEEPEQYEVRNNDDYPIKFAVTYPNVDRQHWRYGVLTRFFYPKQVELHKEAMMEFK